MPYEYIYFSEFTPDKGREYPIGTFTVTGFIINGSGARVNDDFIERYFLFKISEMDLLSDEETCADPDTVYLSYNYKPDTDESITGTIKLKFKYGPSYAKSFKDSFLYQKTKELEHIGRRLSFMRTLKERDEQIASLSDELQDMTQRMGALVEKLQQLKENTYDDITDE